MEDALSLLEFVKRRLATAGDPVLALWLKISGERRAFVEECVSLRGATPLVPLIVRGGLFQNPNCLLDDLVELVSSNRTEFETLSLGKTGSIRSCAILLLAHNELGMPQVSSPAYFPDWFPACGGREVFVTIEDVTFRVDRPLDARPLRLEEISAALVHLEESLVNQMQVVYRRDHRAVNALFDLIRREKESFDELLDGALAELAKTRPETYRPTARDARSLTARIWVLVRTSTPDQLNGRAAALAQALGLREPLLLRPHESLLTVLGRPTHKDIPVVHRVARNILTSVFAGCQLLTAVHHPGDYAEYPVVLMRAIGFDLLRALTTSDEVVATTGDSV